MGDLQYMTIVGVSALSMACAGVFVSFLALRWVLPRSSQMIVAAVLAIFVSATVVGALIPLPLKSNAL